MSLGETLLPSISGALSQDIVPLLHYQVFQGLFVNGQKFWISPPSDATGLLCQAVDVNGHISGQLCLESLPGLCTQSANSSAVPEFLTTVSSNGLSITG